MSRECWWCVLFELKWISLLHLSLSLAQFSLSSRKSICAWCFFRWWRVSLAPAVLHKNSIGKGTLKNLITIFLRRSLKLHFRAMILALLSQENVKGNRRFSLRNSRSRRKLAFGKTINPPARPARQRCVRVAHTKVRRWKRSFWLLSIHYVDGSCEHMAHTSKTHHLFFLFCHRKKCNLFKTFPYERHELDVKNILAAAAKKSSHNTLSWTLSSDHKNLRASLTLCCETKVTFGVNVGCHEGKRWRSREKKSSKFHFLNAHWIHMWEGWRIPFDKSTSSSSRCSFPPPSEKLTALTRRTIHNSHVWCWAPRAKRDLIFQAVFSL